MSQGEGRGIYKLWVVVQKTQQSLHICYTIQVSTVGLVRGRRMVEWPCYNLNMDYEAAQSLMKLIPQPQKLMLITSDLVSLEGPPHQARVHSTLSH